MYFVDLATLAADGMVEVRAVCEPHASSAGFSRVLQGLDQTSTIGRSQLSLLLNSKAVSPAANRTTVYVDGTNGTAGGTGTTGDPVQTITQARVIIRNAQSLSVNAQSNLGGGTIKLRAGTYTPADEAVNTFNYNAHIVIKNDDGVAASAVIVQVTGWRHRFVSILFEGITIQPVTGAARLFTGDAATFTLRAGGTGQAQNWYYKNCIISNPVAIAQADMFVGDHVGAGITTGTYTAATRTVTKVGAFTSYTFASGDSLRMTDVAGGNVTGQYQIASRTSNDAVVLTATPAGSTGLIAAPLADSANISTTTSKYKPCNIKPSNSITHGMRGCYVHHWHDAAALSAFGFVHNCKFYSCTNNGPNPQGMFTYVDIQLVQSNTATPGIHVDALQWSLQGTVASPNDANCIILNLRAWDIHGQGWHHEGCRHNIAVINTQIERYVGTSNNLNVIGSNASDQSLFHFCVWNFTMLGYTSLFFDGPGAGKVHTGGDMSVQGCLLDSALVAYYVVSTFVLTVKDVAQTGPTLDADYSGSSGYTANTVLGYASNTVKPTPAAFPPPSGKTTSRIVPFDLAGQPRSATTAMGAYAAAAEYAGGGGGTPATGVGFPKPVKNRSRLLATYRRRGR
jgi:hypothetical protein